MEHHVHTQVFQGGEAWEGGYTPRSEFQRFQPGKRAGSGLRLSAQPEAPSGTGRGQCLDGFLDPC